MDDLMSAVAESLAEDDVNGAWRHVQGAAQSDVETARLLVALAEAAVGKWHPHLAGLARRAAFEPCNPDRLASLASALVESGDAPMAAALYGRALALRPEDPRLLADRIAALERSGEHGEALRLLRERPEMVVGDGVLSYLYAFHLALSGDLVGASGVAFDHAPQAAFLRARIDGILARGEALGVATARARLATITGVLAMRVSDEEVVEEPPQTAEILARMRGALQAFEVQPEAVSFLATLGSEPLAGVVSERLGVPMEPFNPSTTRSGLLVIFDLCDVSPERARSLRERRDLVIYAHLASSRREHELAPDLLGTYAQNIRFEQPPDDGFSAFDVSPEPFRQAVPRHPKLIDDPLAARWAAVPPGAGRWRARRDRLWAGFSGASTLAMVPV